MIPPESQFTGCLVGQCLGDALGFLVEGEPRSVCRAYATFRLDPRTPPAETRGPFAFGQYSDDSQLARDLLESMVECESFEPADYARRLAAEFTGNRIVGRGRATEAAALRLAAGVPWEEAGTPAPSAGNGSAMRAGPVGLMFYDDPEGLLATAHDQGRMTHADPRCSAGAVAIAGAVALALDPAPVELHRWVATLSDWTGRFDPAFAAELERMEELLELDPDEAAPFIASAGLEEGTDAGWDGVSPFVVPSVLWSLYAFLRTPEKYFEAIRTAIQIGGDVDTTAAMTGAVAGARCGLEKVPPDLARHLTDQGAWGLEALVDLARRAWVLKTGGAE